ncbi:hypothetical protein [Verminephrobacter aporrectodeae]|nr:hypothetical protein [Verminephrobacter aporrectodeae]
MAACDGLVCDQLGVGQPLLASVMGRFPHRAAPVMLRPLWSKV